MELTQEGKEAVADAYKDWVHDEEAQKDNENFLKNVELIKKIDELKYHCDVLEGEIRSIEFNKSRLPSKIIAHVSIVLILVIFYLFFVWNLGVFSLFVTPFYLGACIAEMVKIYKDFKPFVINLPFFEGYCKAHNIGTMDINLEEKKIELRAIRSSLAELDKQLEKRSTKGEDMIS